MRVVNSWWPEDDSMRVIRTGLVLFVLVAAISQATPDPQPRSGPAHSKLPARLVEPISVGELCQALSRRSKTSVVADRAASGIRVLWSLRDEASARGTLSRLAILTDSTVFARELNSGRTRYTLRRNKKTIAREQAWKRFELLAGLNRLVRAASLIDSGEEAEGFGPRIRTYARWEHSRVALRYLRQLAMPDILRLLEGENVRIPAGRIAEKDQMRFLRSVAGPLAKAYSVTEEELVASMLPRVKKHGLHLQMDLSRSRRDSIYLMVGLGASGRPSFAIGQFRDDDLGLPLTRTNPYRHLELLETNIAATPEAPDLPAALGAKLEADIVLPSDGRWGSVLAEIARVTGLDLVSDGYLSRLRSTSEVPARSRVVVAPKGIPVADALDLICRRFGYLWWEEKDSCYFRSRSWPRDMEYEVPFGFLDSWRRSLNQKKPVGAGQIDQLAKLKPRQREGLARMGSHQADASSRLIGKDIAQFLDFYARLGPVQQARVVDRGLVLRSDLVADFDVLSRPFAKNPRPVVIRLSRRAKLASVAPAKAWEVECVVSIQWSENKSVRLPFTVRIPFEEKRLKFLAGDADSPLPKSGWRSTPDGDSLLRLTGRTAIFSGVTSGIRRPAALVLAAADASGP